MDDQNKNLLLATVLSFFVIFAWFVLFPPEQTVPPVDTEATATAPAVPGSGDVASAPAVAGSQTGNAAPLANSPEQTREAALAGAERVEILTDRLHGSLSLMGGRIDDLALSDYFETQDEGSPNVVLLSPVGSPNAYYAIYGWVPGAGTGLNFEDVPGASTPWQVENGTSLTQNSPVTLIWDNGKGLVFRREISVDEDYLFHIRQSVENNTGAEVRLAPYGIVARHGEPDTIGFYILHEGVVRAHDGEIEEIDYNDMPDADLEAREGANVNAVAVEENGWIGFTDKYWMTTLMPAPGQSFNSVSKYTPSNDTYQTDMRLPTLAVAPGSTGAMETNLFAGAKEANLIRRYQNENGFEKFYDSIDWGWFYFLTKPFFRLLDLFNGWIGNMGVAIIGLTLVIKIVLFPLALKSFVSMSRMKLIQPEMQSLKERYGDDRQRFQQEMMALYKKEKVNPASGCLPILLQIPIFFSLYKVLFVTIEMRHAPFFGWITDLSAPDPTSFLNLFGLLPWGAPDPASILAIFSIGVYPILMGITMWLQQKLNPAPTDATQAMIFAWMPWVFMFMLGRFASGLVIYWVANNTITFIQQYTIMRSQGVKPDVFGNIMSTFRKKKTEG